MGDRPTTPPQRHPQRHPQPPTPAVHQLLELGLLWLPEGGVRKRYRQELLAELYLVPRRRQARVALAFVLRARALRDAVNGAPDGSTARGTAPESLRCRVGLHRYHLVSNPDGDRYQCCVRCQKVYPGGGRGSEPGYWGVRLPM